MAPRLAVRLPLGMAILGICYFCWYTPYSGLAKALSAGYLPGLHQPVGGLVLLPAAAFGTLCAMPVFLIGTGWWRHARRRRFGRVEIPFPGRETAASGFWMALVIGTTTLNFTFPGVSILFVLVMMRIETIVLAPTMDLIRRRRIHTYSWIALGLSLLSAIVALTDVQNYRLTFGAILSLAAYLIGYSGRFEIMSRHAKKSTTDLRYMVEEHMTAPVMLVAMLAVPALIGQGSVGAALRVGFTSFLTTPAAMWAFAIGICYEGLFVFTTLIFLDPREYAFCMPVHVCASLLAGVASTYGLRWLFGSAAPSPAQIGAAACVVVAAVALSWPALQARAAARRAAAAQRFVLFVCGGNTSRSAMAAALARVELAAAGAGSRLQVLSAGVAAEPAGRPMAEHAVQTLRQLDVPVPVHRSRQLTADMCANVVAIYCMAETQRAAVVELVPHLRDRVHRLDPRGDIPEPNGAADGYLACAVRLRELIQQRLPAIRGADAAGVPAGT